MSKIQFLGTIGNSLIRETSVYSASCLLCRPEKKKAQHESCELSFTGGKIRTVALETASQIVLRYLLERGGRGRSVLYIILMKGYVH